MTTISNMAKTYKDYDSSRLEALSDEDLNRLYYDAKTGFRDETSSFDQEGFHEGGYNQYEFYGGSFEPYHGASKADQELSDLYRDNVFGASTTGNRDYLAAYDEDQRRMGFEMIFREKDRRRGLATTADTDDVVEEPVQHYDLERLESNNEDNDGTSSIQEAKDRVKAFNESTNDRIDSYYPKSQFEKAQDLMTSVDNDDDNEVDQAQSFANNYKNNFKNYLNMKPGSFS